MREMAAKYGIAEAQLRRRNLRQLNSMSEEARSAVLKPARPGRPVYAGIYRKFPSRASLPEDATPGTVIKGRALADWMSLFARDEDYLERLRAAALWREDAQRIAHAQAWKTRRERAAEAAAKMQPEAADLRGAARVERMLELAGRVA